MVSVPRAGQGKDCCVHNSMQGPAMAWRAACSMLPNTEDFRVLSMEGGY